MFCILRVSVTDNSLLASTCSSRAPSVENTITTMKTTKAFLWRMDTRVSFKCQKENYLHLRHYFLCFYFESFGRALFCFSSLVIQLPHFTYTLLLDSVFQGLKPARFVHPSCPWMLFPHIRIHLHPPTPPTRKPPLPLPPQAGIPALLSHQSVSKPQLTDFQYLRNADAQPHRHAAAKNRL